MEPAVRGEVAQRLFGGRGGGQDAFNRLVSLVYSEVHRIAKRHMQAQPLEQTTAFIHEASRRLADSTNLSFNDSVHFLSICAHAFRCIPVNFAPSRLALNLGGGEHQLRLDDEMDVGVKTPTDIVGSMMGVEELAGIDPTKAKIIEMQFFGGSSVEESEEAPDVSRITVLRDWRRARPWLRSVSSKRAAYG